ncbi:hypothetical protein GCM10027053_00670 [Intrasporangium mesophilum]
MSGDMSEHPIRDGAPDPAEQALRKALGTMNDLEPPRDDLFVQRALLRGRAATARRRSALIGAAAAFVVLGSVGGTWYAANHSLTANSATSAGAGEAGSEAKAPADASGGSGYSSGGEPVPRAPAVASQGTTSVWFEGPSTPVTQGFDFVWPSIASRWPDTFSGAYTTDATNTHLVVAETQPNPALEALVRGAMPSPSDVEFTTATHSFAQKEQVAQQVVDDTASWRSQGVEVYSVRQDGRADRVVVVADEGSTPGVIVRRYGEIVRVVPASPAPSVAPNGGTLPNLHP